MIFYFTFGAKHHDIYARSYGRQYVKIEADDSLSARKKMFELFGNKWASQYTPEQFAGQPEKYGLEEMYIGDADEACCGIEQSKLLELLEENAKLKKQLEGLA